jgi:hypothetical protein
MSNLGVFVAIWAVLAGGVLLLALYRLIVDKREYTVLHVRRSELSLIPHQVVRSEKLNVIDRWGKIATTVAVLYGLALAIGYLYLVLNGPAD